MKSMAPLIGMPPRSRRVTPTPPCHAMAFRDTCQGEQMLDNCRRRCATALFLLSNRANTLPLLSCTHRPPRATPSLSTQWLCGSDVPRSAPRLYLDLEGLVPGTSHALALAPRVPHVTCMHGSRAHTLGSIALIRAHRTCQAGPSQL